MPPPPSPPESEPRRHKSRHRREAGYSASASEMSPERSRSPPRRKTSSPKKVKRRSPTATAGPESPTGSAPAETPRTSSRTSPRSSEHGAATYETAEEPSSGSSPRSSLKKRREGKSKSRSAHVSFAEPPATLIPSSEDEFRRQVLNLPPVDSTPAQEVSKRHAEEDAAADAKRVCAANPALPPASRDPRLRKRETTGEPSSRPSPPQLPLPSFAAIAANKPAAPAAPAAVAAAPTATPGSPGNPTAAPKRRRYPPIVVDKMPDWPKHFKLLREILGHPPNARPFGHGIRFIPGDESEFRAVQKYLTELEKTVHIDWVCYGLEAEKRLKVAIRGLPANTPPQDIEEALRQLEYEPEYVRKIEARQGRPGCIFLAELKRTPTTIPGIYDISELLYMPGIRIESWRGKRGPAQCHRCQKFRHSSHNCHRVQACVRCGGEHAAQDCPRPREDPPTCANCGGDHPANYVSCPVYIREARNKKTAAISTVRPTPVPEPRTEPTLPSAGSSLMAPANDPTPRSSQPPPPPKKRRKKRKKPSKAAVPALTADTEPATDASHRPPPSLAPRSRPTAETRPAAALRPTAPPHPTDPARLTVTEPEARPIHAPRRGRRPRTDGDTAVLDTAFTILYEILRAIRADEDPLPAVLDGIADLARAYSHARGQPSA